MSEELIISRSQRLRRRRFLRGRGEQEREENLPSFPSLQFAWALEGGPRGLKEKREREEECSKNVGKGSTCVFFSLDRQSDYS